VRELVRVIRTMKHPSVFPLLVMELMKGTIVEQTSEVVLFELTSDVTHRLVELRPLRLGWLHEEMQFTKRIMGLTTQVNATSIKTIHHASLRRREFF
jgi:hypothetical protein